MREGLGRAADAASEDHPAAIPPRRGLLEHREQRRWFLTFDGLLYCQLCAASAGVDLRDDSAQSIGMFDRAKLDDDTCFWG